MSDPWTDPRVLAWAREALPLLATEPLTSLALRARDLLGPELGPVALSLSRVWHDHEAKFAPWREFIADREAAEQATSRAIAAWRARRFRDLHALDLCCGAGADAVALSAVVSDVVAVDRDASRLAWARENVARYGAAERCRFLCADVTGPLPEADAAFLDPDRRASGRRRVSPEAYSPPPEAWEAIRRQTPDLAVKVAPGIAYEDIPAGCTAEFIQERGQCREATLWFGDFGPNSRTATVLAGDEGVCISADEPEEDGIASPGVFLYDPGPAVVRAHLVTHLAARLGAWRLDEQTAYLSGDALTETPFASAFRVEEVWPFHLKRLRKALADRGIGALEILTRRFPMTPDELRPRLGLAGDRSASLILTKLNDRPVAILAERT